VGLYIRRSSENRKIDVEELTILVERAQYGDLDAYRLLAHRFQDMAMGYAHALLGDFHLAEDAAQEAFIQAYLDLGKLREPAAFPGWFRRLVFKQCDRITRKKRIPAVPLETVGEIDSGVQNPAELFDKRDAEDQVASAIRSLPEHQRLVVELFYISEFSHREIADFLGAPVHTVKNRLHAARKRLKQELIDMAKENLQSQRPSRDRQFLTHIIDELADLNDRGIQLLLRDIDQKDCVLALKGTNDEVKKKILANLSERVRNYIEEEMEALEDVEASEIQEAQEHIMDQLRIIRPQPKNLSEGYLDMKEDLRNRLREKPVSRMDLDEIVELFGNMSKISAMEGRLALMEYEKIIREDEEDHLLGVGLTMSISSRNSDLIRDLLEKRMSILLKEQETRYNLITEGITELNRGLSAGWMQMKLQAHYSLSDAFIF